MERRLRKGLSYIHLEKITNEPFDDIIGHSETERFYFTIENNDIIYRRLKEELGLFYLPYLGPCVDYGNGDLCLEESYGTFKYYVSDRMLKYDFEEFEDIEASVNHLLTQCVGAYHLDDESAEKMKEIFYQTLGLGEYKNENDEVKKLTKKPIE